MNTQYTCTALIALTFVYVALNLTGCGVRVGVEPAFPVYTQPEYPVYPVIPVMPVGYPHGGYDRDHDHRGHEDHDGRHEHRR